MATEAAELIDTEASSTLDALRASGRTVNATKDLGDGLGSLAGKVVLITCTYTASSRRTLLTGMTGASRGFGRAYATKLALLGFVCGSSALRGTSSERHPCYSAKVFLSDENSDADRKSVV